MEASNRGKRNVVLALDNPEARPFAEAPILLGVDKYSADLRFVPLESMLDYCDTACEIVSNAVTQLSLAGCKKRLSRGTGWWAPVSDARDLANAETLIAKGRRAEIVDTEGNTRWLVNGRINVYEVSPRLTRVPRFTERTDEVIRNLGTVARLIEPQVAGAIA